MSEKSERETTFWCDCWDGSKSDRAFLVGMGRGGGGRDGLNTYGGVEFVVIAWNDFVFVVSSDHNRSCF